MCYLNQWIAVLSGGFTAALDKIYEFLSFVLVLQIHFLMDIPMGQNHNPFVQGSTNRRAPGLVNFAPALAYHFCSIHATWGPPISGALYTCYDF